MRFPTIKLSKYNNIWHLFYDTFCPPVQTNMVWYIDGYKTERGSGGSSMEEEEALKPQ